MSQDCKKCINLESMYDDREKENKVLNKSLYHCIEVIKEHLRSPGEELEPFFRGALKLAEESYNNICTCHMPSQGVFRSGSIYSCTKCNGSIYDEQIYGLRKMRKRRFENNAKALLDELLHKISYE